MTIENFPDYSIDDDGEIFSFKSDKYLTPRVNRMTGYASVCLTNSNGSRNFLVHRLVAKHFVKGYRPYLTVNHIDGDKLNNCASNLEWVSHKANVKKAWLSGAYKKFMTSYSHNKHDLHNARDYPNCSECVAIMVT